MSIWPVSVIHQVSWMGKLNAFNPQRMTSGLSGSPTLVIYRRLSKLNFLATSRPSFMRSRSAVGAVYQIVTSYLSMRPYHVAESNLPLYESCDVPFNHGPQQAYEVPVLSLIHISEPTRLGMISYA